MDDGGEDSAGVPQQEIRSRMAGMAGLRGLGLYATGAITLVIGLFHLPG
jgi:hypothetical protein